MEVCWRLCLTAHMDNDKKQIALRMIPYGLYVLTSQSPDGATCAVTVAWVTQCSFSPPLVVVAIGCQSSAYDVIKKAGAFALNILGKDQKGIAETFSKPVEHAEDTIGGEAFHIGESGSPLLENSLAYLDCNLVVALEKGDHAVAIGEVVDAKAPSISEDRPDEVSLWLKDLGADIYYGG